MAELLGTGSGTPMVITDNRGGGEDGMGFGSNPLLWLITLGFLGRNGGLLGGGGDSGGSAEANTALINANTAAVVASQTAASNAQMQNVISSQNTTNQLNNMQQDIMSNSLAVTTALATQQANNDVKLLLSRIADGNTDLMSEFQSCCCENKVLGLQNTAQIVGAITSEGQATRTLINQLDKENLISQLNDYKVQASNAAQTQNLEAYLNMRFPIPPYGFCPTSQAA